jgi:DNA-binding NarL/FixJ family response regulator
VRALQKLDPNVRIIASSGLDDNSKLTDVMNAGVRHFLSKPYTADKLLKTLADVLNKY